MARPQVLSTRYIDKQKLLALLARCFHGQPCTVEVFSHPLEVRRGVERSLTFLLYFKDIGRLIHPECASLSL
jgi:hypothetical protein